VGDLIADLKRDLRWSRLLLGLPPRVALFLWRARRLARRSDDVFSLRSVTRPDDLRRLLRLAAGRRSVVELGTATGWTAIALALADSRRHLVSYDTVSRNTHDYLSLVPHSTRARIEFVTASGADGPSDAVRVDLLYIDSSHDRDETVAEVRAWQPVLAPDGLIVFDDYTHPDFPGVREAIAMLGLAGEQSGTLYVHRLGAVLSQHPRQAEPWKDAAVGKPRDGGDALAGKGQHE
jgi:predicted O-methyltransferase YrrM